jgi:hypothetical protein
LDFRQPCLAKIAVGLLTLPKWRSFEKILPFTWNAPSFGRTYLGSRSINSNDFFSKTKEATMFFAVLAIPEHRSNN